MIVEKTRVTGSPSESFDFGVELAACLRPGDVLILTGSLGAGKTTLVRGLAKGLAVKSPVSSPSFTLLHIHEPSRPGTAPLHHFDVYRLSGPDEFLGNGLDDYVGGDSITVLEWGDRVRAALPPDLIEISISYGEEDQEREFTLHFPADRTPGEGGALC